MFKTAASYSSPGNTSMTSSTAYSEYTSESSPDITTDRHDVAMAANDSTKEVSTRSGASSTSGMRQNMSADSSLNTPTLGRVNAADSFPYGRISTGKELQTTLVSYVS